MKKFNNGEPYHGSTNVTGAKLHGATDATDYFYFFCPKCPNSEIVRLLDYGIHDHKSENPYNDNAMSYAVEGFTLVFKFQCEKCGHIDFTKISNMGWQCGEHNKKL